MARKNNDTFIPEKTKEDLLFVILPKVAKWAIDSVIHPNNIKFKSFNISQIFQSIQEPSSDIFNALEIAEAQGLLKRSGLIETYSEHQGYPAFLHDNFRDYFAALYLQSLSRSEQIKEIQKMLEYFAWDEPLILFLELNSDEQLLQEIIEFTISRDIILAAICIRAAKTIKDNESLCLRLANRIESSEAYQKIRNFLPHSFFLECYTRRVLPLLPVYILSCLPIGHLIKLMKIHASDRTLINKLQFAVTQASTKEDLNLLKNLMMSSEKEGFIAFWAICEIPTYDAFKTITEIYKNIQTAKKAELNFGVLSRIIKNSREYLSLISYSPSLPELISEFPIDTHWKEFEVLFSKVTRVNSEDISLLEQLIFRKSHYNLFHDFRVYASKLLVKVRGKDAIPILQKRLDTPFDEKNLFFGCYDSLYREILQIVFELDSEMVVRRITSNLVKVENDLESYSEYIVFWEFLAKVQTRNSAKHFIRFVCRNRISMALYFAADQIETWLNKGDIVAEFNNCLAENESAYDGAKLLGASIGIETFVAEALLIFDKTYSTVVKSVKNDPTKYSELPFYRMAEECKNPPPLILSLLKDAHEEEENGHKNWHKDDYEQNLRLLPLAVRSVRCIKFQDNNIIEKVLEIIKWAYYQWLEEDKVSKVTILFAKNELLFMELLIQGFRSITMFFQDVGDNQTIKDFLNSKMFYDLLEYVVMKDDDRAKDYTRLKSASVALIANIPSEYISNLLSWSIDFIKSHLSEEKINFKEISDIILILCQRLDDGNLICSILKSLDEIAGENKVSKLVDLLQKIKVVKGRRFLSVFDVVTKP